MNSLYPCPHLGFDFGHLSPGKNLWKIIRTFMWSIFLAYPAIFFPFLQLSSVIFGNPTLLYTQNSFFLTIFLSRISLLDYERDFTDTNLSFLTQPNLHLSQNFKNKIYYYTMYNCTQCQILYIIHTGIQDYSYFLTISTRSHMLNCILFDEIIALIENIS